MGRIESSNVRIERDPDAGSAQPSEKLPREPKASATPGAAGDSINDLLTLRRQRPAGEDQPAAHATNADEPQKNDGRRSGLRRGLSSDAMQVFQMALQTQNNSRQLLQQAVNSESQTVDSMAQGIEKAAR